MSEIDGDWEELGRRVRAGEDFLIKDLWFNVRVENVLADARVNTVRDLLRLNERDLMAMKNFGKTSRMEVVMRLKAAGLRLGFTPKPVSSVGGCGGACGFC